MVKTYLRYVPKSAEGVIASSAYSGVILHPDGKHALTSALESVCMWNIKQGLLVHKLTPPNSSIVSSMALHPEGDRLAVGYDDGTIRVWNIMEKTNDLTLNGHRGAVACLSYNQEGSLLVSGSNDTHVIVWDCVGENGLFRLHGHKNIVTDVVFITLDATSSTDAVHFLATASTDKFIKIWDLDTQHCVQTLTGHLTEVWSIAVSPCKTRLAAGSGDRFVRIWDLSSVKTDSFATYAGEVERSSKKRVQTVRYSSCGELLMCQTADKVLDCFRIRPQQEAKKKAKRRAKRVREKKEKSKAKSNTEEQEEKEEGTNENEVVVEMKDVFELLLPLRTKSKIVGCCFGESGNQIKKKNSSQTIAIALSNNSVANYTIQPTLPRPQSPYTLTSSITQSGHRSGVRSVCLSADNTLMMTTDSIQIKIWNVVSGQCIRTLDSGYGLSGLFVPGDRHVIITTRDGCLECWEIGSGALVEKVQAHEGSVWSIDATPDKKGFITGGSDKELKTWEYELMATKGEDERVSKRLSLVHTRTLKLTEEVLCVKVSPDGRYFALGLLDATIKIFYADSLKFFLSLYGHKLPVLSIDISSDSTLLVSGSADKNVKIWGMDFGDCHKSMFAHSDSVMAVRWVPKTHYFFTVGKDKLIKFWDGDKFEHVLSLTGHHSEVWGLVVNKGGDTVYTVGNDRSIRTWEQTDEQVFLEEERENRLEEIFDEGALVEEKSVGDIEGLGLESQGDSSAVARAKAGKDSLKAGERLIEALDMAQAEEERWSHYKLALAAAKKPAEKQTNSRLQELLADKADKEPKKVIKPPPNPLMMGLKADRYLLRVLKRIKSAELDEALMVLPFAYVIRLVAFLHRFVKEALETELSVRCLLCLLSVHQNQIISNRLMRESLTELRLLTRKQLRRKRDTIGVNKAGLQHLITSIKEESTSYFFGDAADAPYAKKAKN